jgi:protein phosphatase
MLSYCAATDKGGRENNEDAYITTEHNNFYLLAVADGLGGHVAGEVASMLAIKNLGETIKSEFAAVETISLELMKKLLIKGFRKANEEICSQAKTEERHNMGTTLVAALLNDEGKGVIANIGDSRAYLIGNKMTRITKDHSYVQELVDRGMITQEEAAVHPEKNIVTKIIGMDGVEPDFYEVELGDNTLLLCSDGLTDALRDEKVKEIVISSKIENICKNLVDAAKPTSRDNITVVAAKRLYGTAVSQ